MCRVQSMEIGQQSTRWKSSKSSNAGLGVDVVCGATAGQRCLLSRDMLSSVALQHHASHLQLSYPSSALQVLGEFADNYLCPGELPVWVIGPFDAVPARHHTGNVLGIFVIRFKCSLSSPLQYNFSQSNFPGT